MTRNARWQSRRPRYRADAHVGNFAILVPAPELSLSDAKDNLFRKMRDTLYRERQLWIGNESAEIRFVNGSSVAGTSASSPGVPRHMYLVFQYFSNKNCLQNSRHWCPKNKELYIAWDVFPAAMKVFVLLVRKSFFPVHNRGSDPPWKAWVR